MFRDAALALLCEESEGETTLFSLNLWVRFEETK